MQERSAGVDEAGTGPKLVGSTNDTALMAMTSPSGAGDMVCCRPLFPASVLIPRLRSDYCSTPQVFTTLLNIMVIPLSDTDP